ncbi:MAG: hypothetical protein WCJ33_00815 [Pseudomonadota bacterium]
MSDMYGTVCSNDFKVKDVKAFTEWFNQFYFGDDIDISINEAEHEISFGGDVSYPSAYPRIIDVDNEIEDVDLSDFATELCQHLEEGEVFNLVAGGNEKLCYVAFSQLIIAQAHPEKPYFSESSSDSDKVKLLSMVLSQS